MDYCSLADLIVGYLPSVTGAAEQLVLAGMLRRASRAIDSRTRRPADAFSPAAELGSEAVFYGTGQAVLLLPEFITASVERVTCPATYYLPESWSEFRRREVTTGALRVGLHTATKLGMLTPRIVWATGVPFAVTARWGFAATPGEITEATLQLVRGWWLQQSGNLSGPVGDVQARPDRQLESVWRAVDELIKPFVLEEALQDESAGEIERGDLLNSEFNPPGAWGSS